MKNIGLRKIGRESLDLPGDPVFYHPELNILRCWSDFEILIPEKYGWIFIGHL